MAHNSNLHRNLLVRWTVGNVSKDGFDCLRRSILNFQSLYSCRCVLCYNCEYELISYNGYARFPGLELYNQAEHIHDKPTPIGVSWKLYPSRLNPDGYEISIDNDLVIEKSIKEIDEFLNSDSTLLLEGNSRTYGKFGTHVPKGYQINSGIYGMPPGFDLQKYINFYSGESWEKNAFGQHEKNETFDEQGIIALALLSYHKRLIIPSTTISNCENNYEECDGMHFISLNRVANHQPYKIYRTKRDKWFI